MTFCIVCRCIFIPCGNRYIEYFYEMWRKRELKALKAYNSPCIKLQRLSSLHEKAENFRWKWQCPKAGGGTAEGCLQRYSESCSLRKVNFHQHMVGEECQTSQEDLKIRRSLIKSSLGVHNSLLQMCTRRVRAKVAELCNPQGNAGLRTDGYKPAMNA